MVHGVCIKKKGIWFVYSSSECILWEGVVCIKKKVLTTYCDVQVYTVSYGITVLALKVCIGASSKVTIG